MVFPGGVGTAEEVLYLLGILLDDANVDVKIPVVFTGPAESASYFERLHDFVGVTLGPVAQGLYRIIIDEPDRVAEEVLGGLDEVRSRRDEADEPYFFNWQVNVPLDFQLPFFATHSSMSALALHSNQTPSGLAVNLRRAFSGIVAGNVRESGIRLVEERGPFELSGDPNIIEALGRLLADFVNQGRMKLTDPDKYVPCYRIAS